MKWEGREESENVDDRRGFPVRTAGIAGGGLVITIIALLFGLDPEKVKQFFPAQPAAEQQAPGEPRKFSPEEEKLASFTRVILKDTEIIWTDLFRKHYGTEYQKPVLVLFTDEVNSKCGMAGSAVGPFYCPGDHQVYIDLSFYRDMERKLNAPGEFARAYVIAHEVGHHIQKLRGYSARVDEARRRGNAVETNQMSVRLELQADFLAGVWAHHAQRRFNYLEKGDVEGALNAAFEIGDDRLQSKAQGRVVPDSFTHGTSKQRMRWFTEGFRTGDLTLADRLFDLRYGDL